MMRLLLGTALCIGILALLGLNAPVSDKYAGFSSSEHYGEERGPLVEILPEEPFSFDREEYDSFIDVYSDIFKERGGIAALLQPVENESSEALAEQVTDILEGNGHEEFLVIPLGGGDLVLLFVPEVANLHELEKLLALHGMSFYLEFSKDAPANEAALLLPQKDSEEGIILEAEPALEASRYILDARQGLDPYGLPSICIVLSDAGAALFESLTAQNIGRRLAIVMGNKVLTAPVIQQKISGGKLVITGNFTIEEAADLSLALRAGSLPPPFTILESRIIAPAAGKGVGS